MYRFGMCFTDRVDSTYCGLWGERKIPANILLSSFHPKERELGSLILSRLVLSNGTSVRMEMFSIRVLSNVVDICHICLLALNSLVSFNIN